MTYFLASFKLIDIRRVQVIQSWIWRSETCNCKACIQGTYLEICDCHRCFFIIFKSYVNFLVAYCHVIGKNFIPLQRTMGRCTCCHGKTCSCTASDAAIPRRAWYGGVALRQGCTKRGHWVGKMIVQDILKAFTWRCVWDVPEISQIFKFDLDVATVDAPGCDNLAPVGN